MRPGWLTRALESPITPTGCVSVDRHSKGLRARVSVFMFNSGFLIALGANLPSEVGSPAQTLVAALARLGGQGLSLRAVSRFYRSPAFPAGSGPDYVNAAAVVAGEMAPEAALEALHRVEESLGRVRSRRWEARKIDLDLIAAGAAVLPDR